MDRELSLYDKTALFKLDPNGVLDEWVPSSIDSIENIGGKSQTNFMDEYLTIKERPTKLGQARQVLAELASEYEKIRANKPDLNNVYVRASVKRCVHLVSIYKELCAELGVEKISDSLIEENQREEHLKMMFKQSLRAACSSHGVVDEGDLQYAEGVGVSVSECQREVKKFLYTWWGGIRKFTLKEQNEWLDRMWEKYGT